MMELYSGICSLFWQLLIDLGRKAWSLIAVLAINEILQILPRLLF